MWLKFDVPVPAGIRYLSEWIDFSLDKYPDKCIIHKQIPGCGFTEYALTCPFPVILSSPRKMLMENKKDQHGDDVFLVVSEFDRDSETDTDITKPESSFTTKKKLEEYCEWQDNREVREKSAYSKLFKELGDYITYTYSKGILPKIIVTYDSTYLVKKVLEQMGIVEQFYLVVDEFQSLLEDARFKADIETEFLTISQYMPKVVYVSATPMLDKYIKRIPELSFLPYYQFDWEKSDPTRVKSPDLKIRTMSSVGSKMDDIIQSYLNNNLERVIVDRGGRFEEVVSNEAVFYVNSVNHIINAIQRNNLNPDQVNILCSNTPENQKRIDRKLGKGNFKIGKVPLRGEAHKMFTMCTRTTYLGADFYSTCARSFIFSDSNSDCLSVDISMDLAQILGRQRLLENPWHNSAEFYYRVTCDYKKMTEDDLKKIIESKLQKSYNLIEAYNSAPDHTKNDTAEVYQREARREKYKNNYISVNRRKDDKSLTPVINNLVIINEERTFDIQQVDYANRFSVFQSIKSEFSNIGKEGEIVSKFFLEYDQLTTYIEKSRTICEYLLDNPNHSELIISNLSDHDKIKQQLIVLGPEKMKGWGYNLTKIKQAMGIIIFDRSTLNSVICSTFIVGQRYTRKYIKEELKNIYESADFHGTPKATDLENWFEIKEVKIPVGTKREIGFEIISKK